MCLRVVLAKQDDLGHRQRRPVLARREHPEAILHEGSPEHVTPRPPATAAWMPIRLLAVQAMVLLARPAASSALSMTPR
jgi:hypothetical protein